MQSAAPYRGLEPWAAFAKGCIQMGIGVILVGVIIVQAWRRQANILEPVAIVLSFSAAVDLAYALFTTGPDEAIDPVIIAVAAAILFSVSTVDINHLIELSRAGAIAILVLVLGGLFVVRHTFIIKPKRAEAAAREARTKAARHQQPHGP